jgi:hypothetical protein
MPQNTERMARVLGFPKTSSVFLGNAFSMLFNLALTFHIRELLPFSGAFNVIMRLSSSMSIHFNLVASPDRIPVSLSSTRNVESFLPALAISARYKRYKLYAQSNDTCRNLTLIQ